MAAIPIPPIQQSTGVDGLSGNDMQSNINQRFEDVNQRLDDINQRLDGMDQRFDDMNQRLDQIENRQQNLRRGDGAHVPYLPLTNRDGRSLVEAGLHEIRTARTIQNLVGQNLDLYLDFYDIAFDNRLTVLAKKDLLAMHIGCCAPLN